ncbi:hypothetical protein HNQ56_003799 [Anaerotaenia torta]|uniref:DUF5688 family protein n=1 Tax=Anaerotaenia torta TaxID=433293 RepID=UPI003D1B892A
MNEKMDFEQFMEAVKNEIKKIAGEEYPITISRVFVTNGEYNNICIRRRDAVGAPAIYLEDYYTEYQDGKDMQYIVRKILALALGHQIDMNAFTQNIRDYGWARPKLRARLINYERNIKLLQTVPHERMLDLAVVPYLVISRREGIMSMAVNNYLLSGWGIEPDELLRTAKENTLVMEPVVIEKMTDFIIHMMLRELNGREAEDTTEREEIIRKIIHKDTDSHEMYVVTNEDHFNGAFVAFQPKVLAGIADQIGTDGLYILPCSIHEIIVVPVGYIETEDMRNVVYMVNQTEVSENEFLSNTVYEYNRNSDQVMVKY